MAAIVERRSRPQVTVNLDDPKDGIVNRYTTGDEINFNVTVTVREDVMIGALQITFEGCASQLRMDDFHLVELFVAALCIVSRSPLFCLTGSCPKRATTKRPTGF
ncbi:unnamed protein product [Aspergillus oryzae RIB40]|uniref:DNA, SC138 n=1 Tax=Aspergillus oryzae (strain ATCC 42149 / RIB 40) TaxID=510516 RepID=Q2U1S9_ASPOR|nr:unnamed protein product [Aspergillus oryzae RIB40]KOC17336.1 hypothetical protein AFLA70_383g001281 [Aspergillus flavus AF70]BAE64486.1 unnamed protein product [Aspergillus oryzae RIB40]